MFFFQKNSILVDSQPVQTRELTGLERIFPIEKFIFAAIPALVQSQIPGKFALKSKC